jgi:hypothetical protein
MSPSLFGNLRKPGLHIEVLEARYRHESRSNRRVCSGVVQLEPVTLAAGGIPASLRELRNADRLNGWLIPSIALPWGETSHLLVFNFVLSIRFSIETQ